MLVEGLPPDSARHRRDPDSQGWKPSDHIAALSLDALQALFQLTKAANTEGGEYQPPQPISRPGMPVDPDETPEAKARQRAYTQSVIDQLIPPERR